MAKRGSHRTAAIRLATAAASVVLLVGSWSLVVGASAPPAQGELPARLSPTASIVPSLPASPSASPMASPTPGPLVIGVHHNDFAILDSQIDAIQQGSGARIGVSLIELGGAAPQTWSFNGDRQFAAASTYKLPVLMAEAQLISSRPTAANDALCYQASDWEDGWYEDYTPGMCFSRGTLSARIGQQSDNTAGHMLVRAMGGTAALNSYARAHGASESAFFVSNVTTANDLARLMADEARGNAGGPAAQAWLYPLLSRTAFETGIPAGIGGGAATVVHKVGLYDSVASDAGLIMGSPNGAYVLAVCSDGPGGDQGMAVVARVSAAVWQFESNVPR